MGVLILGTKKSSVLLEWVFLRYVAAFRMGLRMAPPATRCCCLCSPPCMQRSAALCLPLAGPPRHAFFLKKQEGLPPTDYIIKNEKV